MTIGPASHILYLIAFWAIVIGAPIMICTVVYRLLNKKGYPKAALAFSLLALIAIIILYNFIPIG